MFSTRVEHYHKLDSSMKLAKKRAVENQSEGLVIWADEIEKAQGRHGRKWHADLGGMWISLILRPKISIEKASFFNYIAVLSLYEMLKKEFQANISIKWPNDIVWKDSNQKIGAFLSLANGRGAKLDYLIWGIGLNISNSLPKLQDFSGLEVSFERATSLQNQGIFVKVEDCLWLFLKHLEKKISQFESSGYSFISLQQEFESACSTVGQQVKLYTDEANYKEGLVRGVNSQNGSLILETDQGIKEYQGGDCFHLRRLS